MANVKNDSNRRRKGRGKGRNNGPNGDTVRSNDGESKSDRRQGRSTLEFSSGNSKQSGIDFDPSQSAGVSDSDSTNSDGGSFGGDTGARRGRGRGRRSNRDNSASARTEGNEGTNQESEELGETPIRRVKLGRKPRQSKAEQAAVVGLIAVSLNAVYGTAALFAGQHWELGDEESILYANSLDNALKTLPDYLYGTIRAYVEKFVPWVSLAITAGAITVPRIQASQKLFNERRKPKPVETSNPPIDIAASKRRFTNGEDDQTSSVADTFQSFPGAD